MKRTTKKRHTLRYILLILCLTITTGFAITTSYVISVLSKTPTITQQQLESEATWNIYDDKGQIIASQTDTKRQYIKYKDIPQLYIDSVLSTEDKDFFHEKGISLPRTTKAVFDYVIAKALHRNEPTAGGSTIKQQLIKNVAYSTLTKDRTVQRKIQEAWLAQQLTDNWSNQQILEWYINRINMGEHSYGADTVCYTYFGQHLYDYKEKTPENISKMALIAGLGQAPSTYNLYDNPKAVQQRRDIVLNLMYRNHKLTKKQYHQAKSIPITQDLKPRFWQTTESNKQISEHNAYITSVLKQVKSLGYDLDKTPLQIYTHLNQEKDSSLQAIVANPIYYKDNGQQIAATIVDPNTGNVIAQSGSRNQANEEPYSYNRATQRSRSSGSTIKPFIDYGPAIEYNGLGSTYQLDSSPYQYPGTSIIANNYGGYSYGIVDMKKALRLSLNTPAIRILDNVVGTSAAKTFLTNLNMDVKDNYGSADALGLDLSTEDFAAGFAAIANGGTYHQPNYIDHLVFSDGSSKSITTTSRQAMKASTAYILAKILEGTTHDGYSAQGAKIPEYQGYLVKTGTVGYDTNDGVFRPDLSASDSWMSGATKSIAASVWTGYDAPNEPNHWITADQTTRADIFVAIMKTFNQGLDTSDFTKPDTVSQSGTGFEANYAPLDKATTVANINIPSLTPFTNNFVNVSPKAHVDKNDSAWPVPNNFTEGTWHNNLDADTTKLYQAWQTDPTLPTFESQLDDKTWHQ